MAAAEYVPLEKRSKKEQRKAHVAKRIDWNGVNPVTKVIPDSRKQHQERSEKLSGLYEYD